MKPQLLTPILGILSGIIFSGCSLFQWAMPASTLSDANVLAMLETIDLTEIDAASLAKQKASSEDTRTFASLMLNEHSTSLQEGRLLAQRIPLQPERPALASTATQTHQRTMQELRTLSGRDFDRAYLKYEIKMHEQAIDLIKSADRSVDNSQLHQHLQQTEPDLAKHLFAARTLERQLVAQY